MREAILEKITKELHSGIDTEPKALYLLAEIRKYIDRGNEREKRNYPNLYFYCNWVLHIRMDRTPAKRILNRFESVISDTQDLKEISKIIIEQEKDFYSFVSLKEELQTFFEENSLPTTLLSNSGRWFKFKKLLVETLIDCPLVNEGMKISKFSYEKGEDEQIRFRVVVNEIKRLGSFKVTLKEKSFERQ
jgi:hypothetical protein